jgi:hypothetical protein
MDSVKYDGMIRHLESLNGFENLTAEEQRSIKLGLEHFGQYLECKNLKKAAEYFDSYEKYILDKVADKAGLGLLLYKVLLSIVESFVSALWDENKAKYESEVNIKANVVYRLHARLMNFADDIYVAANNGCADMALARWRGIFEGGIHLIFIAKFGTSRTAEAFMYRSLINDFNVSKSIYADNKESEFHVENPIYTREEYELLSECIGRLKKDENWVKATKHEYDWAKVDTDMFENDRVGFRSLVRICELCELLPIYKVACNVVHAGPSVLNFTLNQNTGLGVNSMQSVRNPDGIETAIQLTVIVIEEITTTLYSLYSSKKESEVFKYGLIFLSNCVKASFKRT